jgi:MFS family permease
MPSTQTRWLMLALLFACRSGLGFQFQALGSVSASLVSQYGFSYTEIGTLIGFFMLPGLFISLPAGFVGRYLPDSKLAALGLLGLAAGGVISALAQGFGWFVFARVVAGVGFVLSTLYMTKIIADWFSGKELATAMSILVMSWPFGIALGQIVHTWVAVTFDWRIAFLTTAVYCAAAAVALFLFYRVPVREAQVPSAVAMTLPRTELILTLLAASVWGLFNAGYIAYLSFAPRVLQAGGYGATQAAAVISIASWVMIVSAAVCGQIADRTGKRDLIVYVCLSGAIIALLLLPFTEYAVAVSLLFGLIGAAPAGVIMALTAEAMAPQRRAFGMGVFFSFYFVIMTVAPPMAGLMFDRSGNPYGSIVFGAALIAAAMLAHVGFRWVQRSRLVSTARATRG